MKKNKLLLSVILALAVTFSTAQNYSGGSGTSGDPYQISNKADLKYLSEHSREWSKYFIQTASITFVDTDFQSGGGFYNNGDGFIPIGNSSTYFTGSYDGDGFTIDNLYINRSATDYIGLFGYLNNADIDGVNLNDVDITGNEQTGALTGLIEYGTIDDCFVSGSVTGEENSGGLVGELRYRAVIHNCGADVTVIGEYNVGGFAARNFSIDYRLIKN